MGMCGSKPETASLNMSPVERWQRQYSFFTIGACVPLPAPGGPTKIVLCCVVFESQRDRRVNSLSNSIVAIFPVVRCDVKKIARKFCVRCT